MLRCEIRDGLAWATVIAPTFVSGEELVEALRALERSTHFPRGTGLFLDGRVVSPDAGSHAPDELTAVAAELRNLGIGRCALVPMLARVDQAQRFAQAAKSQSLPVAVFLDPEPALRWLQTGDAPSA
jgi:hypothetical protein